MEKERMSEKEKQLQQEILELHVRLAESHEMLHAIKNGGVDAIVVSGSNGDSVYSLASAETPYRFLIESMNEGAASLSVDGTILYCNHHFVKMISTSHNLTVGANIRQFFDEKEKLAALLKDGLNQKCEEEISFFNQKGILRHLHLSFSPLPKGSFGAFVLIVTDITERKQSELKMLESESKFKNLVWDMNVGVLLQGSKSEILLCNPKALELLGMNENQLLGMSSLDPEWNVIHQDGSPFPGNTHPVPQAIETHLPVRNIIMGVYNPSKGVRVWLLVDALPQLNNDGTIRQIICTFIDISQRILAQEKVNYLAAIVQSSNDAIIGKDLNGMITSWNTGAEKLFGYLEKEIMGHSITQIIPPDRQDEEVKIVDKIKQGICIQNLETVRLTKSGKPLNVSVTVSPILDTSGKILGASKVLRDITDWKNIESELIKAKEEAQESDRLKSAFLANISHEIRTPMNGILGFADLLNTPDLTSDEQDEYIGVIQKCGNRMLNIINDIVDISKIEAGLMLLNITETDLHLQTQFVYSFLKTQSESKGLQLSYKNGMASKEFIIKTDREKLYAILINLVRNAIKFTDKGSIEFGYTLKSSKLSGKSKILNYDIEFYVKDTGIGIPLNRQKAIFDRFIQADISDERAFQGAGLGLSITKSYVEMLGGNIWVESKENKGSTFHFTIPQSA